VIDRIVYATMNYPINITIPFSKSDPKIYNFRELNEVIKDRLQKYI